MNLRQNAVKGVVWSAITSWGRQVIAFIVFSLLARLLGPETFGLVAMASVFLAFIQIFVDQGFSEALVQRHELEPKHLDTAFWTNLGIGLLITGFCISTAGLIANLFSQPQLTPIIRWLSLSFLISALSKVQEAILRRNLAFKPLAIRSLVAVVAGGLCGVIMAFMGFGVWSLVGQQLTNGLVQILVLWWASDWRPGLNVSLRHFRELFSFGINVVVMNILEYVNIRADDFLIGYFLGPVALGYYSIAYRLMMIVLDLLTNTMNQVAIPLFSRLQKEPERMREAFYRVTELASLVSFPIYLAMAALAPELVRILFGTKWLPSIPVIQVLSLIGVLHSVFYFNGTVIIAMGKPSWKLMINLIYSIANFAAFIAVVHWGIVAVAAAYVIRGYLIAPPIELWSVWRLIDTNLSTYLRQYIGPLIGSLAMVATIFGVKHFLSGFVSLYILLGVCVVSGALIYMVTILMIAPKSVRQVLDIAQLVLPIRTGKN
jgi:Membrane protein involved in the export of O-antigen and teichoic acid